MKRISSRLSAVAETLLILFLGFLPIQAYPSPHLVINYTTVIDGVAATNQLPVIAVWYESSLKFGQQGNPQTQVNILGNASDPDGSVSSLSYRLNNGPSSALTIGPDGLRLVGAGDFDVNIDISALSAGTNTVLITATDNSGGTQTKTVVFNYTKGKVWPLPYSTSWSAAASILDQAQVVDGIWRIESGGVRPTQIGYDRLIAIGDVSWSNYEVLVPITIHGFYPDPNNPADEGGVGIIARWQGHIGSGQPPSGWTQLGAYGYFSNTRGGLALRLNGSSPITTSFAVVNEKTYLFKLRADTSTQGGLYSFKVWEQGKPEPSWSDPQFSKIVNVVDSNGDLLKGSVLLVAHRVDATFGDVTICPFTTTYALSLKTTGNGTVAALPAKSAYQCGEGVTVTAAPAAGWQFTGWSGDNSSTSSTIAFNMTRPISLTANFLQAPPIFLGYKSYIPYISN